MAVGSAHSSPVKRCASPRDPKSEHETRYKISSLEVALNKRAEQITNLALTSAPLKAIHEEQGVAKGRSLDHQAAPWWLLKNIGIRVERHIFPKIPQI